MPDLTSSFAYSLVALGCAVMESAKPFVPRGITVTVIAIEESVVKLVIKIAE